MNLCKDCQWIENEEYMPRCLHPQSSHVDPVTGEPKGYFCALERLSATGCGPEGKNWTPRIKADVA